MSTNMGSPLAEKLPASFIHQIPPPNVDFAVQGVEALHDFIHDYKGEHAVNLRAAGMRALLDKIPTTGKVPSWPDMPTVFAVPKPKETLWIIKKTPLPSCINATLHSFTYHIGTHTVPTLPLFANTPPCLLTRHLGPRSLPQSSFLSLLALPFLPSGRATRRAAGIGPRP